MNPVIVLLVGSFLGPVVVWLAIALVARALRKKPIPKPPLPNRVRDRLTEAQIDETAHRKLLDDLANAVTSGRLSATYAESVMRDMLILYALRRPHRVEYVKAYWEATLDRARQSRLNRRGAIQ